VSRPRLLDLYCGAGGAAMGYHRAGFDVVGVDVAEQPNYPFAFVCCDALWALAQLLYGNTLADLHLGDYDAIHASPPCQFATDYRRTGVPGSAENWIPATRHLLEQAGVPYVIENVERAASQLRDPVLLCGSQFDLDVKRHRLFECNWPATHHEWPCRHKLWADDRYVGATNRNGRRTVEVGVWRIPLAVQLEAMGVTWPMTLEELSEAIPPAYTEFLGEQLREHLAARV
jgi:DNA (cytosine-5)-methyltransferase 1